MKSQFGFHIIKVVDKKPATTKTLDEVRPQITEQLSWEKAQSRAGDLAAQLEKEISTPADLDKAAQKEGLKVQESGFFTRDEPILGLGPVAGCRRRSLPVEPGPGERRRADLARLRVHHGHGHAGAAHAQARTR